MVTSFTCLVDKDPKTAGAIENKQQGTKVKET